jgi:hypothetical protein
MIVLVALAQAHPRGRRASSPRWTSIRASVRQALLSALRDEGAVGR